MDEIKEFINSIREVKKSLYIKTKEDDEDVQNNLKDLEDNAYSLQNLPLKKIAKKDNELINIIVDLHLCLIEMIADLKDINTLINKTVENKKQQQ